MRGLERRKTCGGGGKEEQGKRESARAEAVEGGLGGKDVRVERSRKHQARGCRRERGVEGEKRALGGEEAGKRQGESRGGRGGVKRGREKKSFGTRDGGRRVERWESVESLWRFGGQARVGCESELWGW